MKQALARVGKFDAEQCNQTETGLIQSLTVTNSIDCVGLDIVFVDGEEASDRIEELRSEISPDTYCLVREARTACRLYPPGHPAL